MRRATPDASLPLPPHGHHQPPFFSPILSVSAAQFIRFPLFLLFHANPSVDTSFASRPHPPESLSHVAPVGRQLRTSAPGSTETRRARQTAEGTSSWRRRTFNSDCDRGASVESSRRKNVGSGINWQPVGSRCIVLYVRNSDAWLRFSKCKFYVAKKKSDMDTHSLQNDSCCG